MRMIGKQSLEALEITIPRLEKQQCIIELNQLSTEEQRLLSLLLAKRKRLVNYP